MKDFLYIKPQKTGTKSVRLSLSKYTENDKGIKITDKNCDIHRHKTFLQYAEIFNNAITKETVLIMSIRNPFDRMVSWYFDSLKRRMKQFTVTPNSFTDAIKNFPDFVDRLPALTNFNKGAENINYIRLEKLQDDFDKVCDKIGIPQQQLPHHNKTKHKHYTEYYDDDTREIVAQKYAKDIEYFGYKF